MILYGGAAGGGKTDLALGKALTQHQRSLILRREFPQLKGIIDRAQELYGEYGKYSAKTGWRCQFAGKRRSIEFGSCQYEQDKLKYQGRAHDLKVFDEAANFLESQVEFIAGWNRSEDPSQHCQVLLCSNPPTDATGDWLIRWFAPWLDPKHPRPAAPGELRWFASVNGVQYECLDGQPFIVVDGKQVYDFDPSKVQAIDIVRPLTRTFIPARVTDNPFYAATGYVAKLQALPEPLRSKMLYGDFAAGREDPANQVIPTAWVMLAQQRWLDRQKPSTPMSAMGVDVARGGADKTVITVRYGNWFDKQITEPGTATPDGPAVRQLVFQNRKDRSHVNIDVIGVGSSAYDSIKETLGAEFTIAMNGSAKSEKTDRSGQLGFVNKRAEWWWGMREALDPEKGDDLALPPDPELRADLCAPTWKMTARGIQVESKDDIIKRIGRSPDKGDSAVYAQAIEENASAWVF